MLRFGQHSKYFFEGELMRSDFFCLLLAIVGCLPARAEEAAALIVVPQAAVSDKIVARVGSNSVYEREVREAVNQHGELFSMEPKDRKVKEKELYKEELRKLVEREVILNELFGILNEKRHVSTLKKLKDAAATEAGKHLKEMRKIFRIESEEEFESFLNGMGLSKAGLRRHYERGFMMGAYLGERVRPIQKNIGPSEIRKHYDEHPNEFEIEETVKWQNLFVRADRFEKADDAKNYADKLVDRVRKEDFAKLIKFDEGISKDFGGFGIGQRKGEINPPELEPIIFEMKQGEVKLVPFGCGYHIIRIAERNSKQRPFDEEVKEEIRKKLTNMIAESEYRKIVEELWRKSPPKILDD
jgi:peptidyl-prolyl cis-trans isomerase SurA